MFVTNLVFFSVKENCRVCDSLLVCRQTIQKEVNCSVYCITQILINYYVLCVFFVKFLCRKKRHLVCYNASCDNNYYEL